jgi:large subunit ribosomal protein L30
MTADKKTKSGAEGAEDVKPTVKKAAATKKVAATKPAAKKVAAEKPAAEKKPAAKKPATKKAAVAKDEPVAVAPQPAGAAAEAIAAIEEMAATAKPAAKKAAAKRASTSRLRITQVRSQIGFARAQRKVLAGLGLGRIGKSVLRHDDPCIRGMVAKVAHLVRVEEVEA